MLNEYLRCENLYHAILSNYLVWSKKVVFDSEIIKGSESIKISVRELKK